MIDVNDYNFKSKRRRITHQNTYFNERFGRSDFEEIVDTGVLGDAMAYIMKYIEKSGERIVYSKNLPQFFCPISWTGISFVRMEKKSESLFCPINSAAGTRACIWAR